jgi:glutamate dehydrogenase/leucine dehydrogenase
VQFTDLAGNQGHTLATITQIDTTQPQAIAVMYSPSTTTNGNVTATLITDKPVTVLGSGRTAFDANGVVIATPYEATGVAISRQYEFTDNT